jgi:hypothetical protein
MNIIKLKTLLLSILLLPMLAFATPEDGVPVIPDDPTEEQMEQVRKGAQIACESVEGDNEREQCVADYYAAHNLDEEPSCD